MRRTQGKLAAWQGLAGALIASCAALAMAEESPPVANPASMPREMTQLGDELYFTADDGIHGRELWRYSPDTGCRLAADLVPGHAGSDPRSLLAVPPWLYFVATTPECGTELWQWDSSAETATVIDLSPQPKQKSSMPAVLCRAGNRLYVAADTASQGRELCVMRLGLPGSLTYLDLAPGTTASVLRHSATSTPDGTVFFCCRNELWSGKGNVFQPVVPATVVEVALNADRDGIVLVNGRVVFTGRRAGEGFEPWATDGTAEGTRLLRDIYPGEETSSAFEFFPFGALAWFAADDGEHGREVWCTDGTSDGTRLVGDVCPGRGSSDPYGFTAAGRYVYFLAEDGQHGRELWRTDGTEPGTLLVADLCPGATGSNPWSLRALGNILYFCATTPGHGDELWRTDGSESGTRLVCDVLPGPDHSGPNNLRVYRDCIVFSSDEPSHGEELWISDGTAAGTRLLADLYPPHFNPGSEPHALTAWGDALLFAARDRAVGMELWSSDGTEKGTRLLCDTDPGPADGEPRQLTPAGSRVFFTARDSEHGREVWSTGGSPEATRVVRDIRAGPGGSDPENLVAYGNRVCFIADDGRHGRTLWVSDGTEAGTRPLLDARRNRAPVTKLFELSGRLGFYAEEAGGPALWISEGTAASTRRVGTVPPGWRWGACGDTSTLTGTVPTELWQAALLHPAEKKRGGTAPLRVDGTTYFVAYTGSCGAELWKTDGSPEGTVLMRDAFPGPAGSSPEHLTWAGQALYFIAESPEEGRVLWRSDGTHPGTYVAHPSGDEGPLGALVAVDVAALGERLVVAAPNPRTGWDPNNVGLALLQPDAAGVRMVGFTSIRADGNPQPRQFTPVGPRLFFTADDGVHGEELWTVDEGLNVRLVRDILPAGELTPLGR